MVFLSPRRVSPFLAWGYFHARSRFPRSTVPEEKWGTTRSLIFMGNVFTTTFTHTHDHTHTHTHDPCSLARSFPDFAQRVQLNHVVGRGCGCGCGKMSRVKKIVVREKIIKIRRKVVKFMKRRSPRTYQSHFPFLRSAKQISESFSTNGHS